LIGGDLTIYDGALYAPSGRINLASTASKGKVIPTHSDLLMEGFEKQGNINITSSQNFSYFDEDGDPLANVDVIGYGGEIFIRGGKFVLDNARMYADTYGYESGRIDIAIDGDMHVTNSSEIAADNYGDGQGTFVDITANELRLEGVNVYEIQQMLSEIDIDFYIKNHLKYRNFSDINEEEAANLEKEIRAKIIFLVDSVEEILSETDANENISFDTVLDKINLNEENQDVTDIFADISIDIKNRFGNTITIGNISAGPEATGGNIKINTSFLKIDTGIIQVVTEGPGKAGNIEIEAEQIELPALGFINATTGFNFEYPTVEKEDGGGFGQGGNITINATDEIYVNSFGNITVGADVGTSGKAGNIYLNTQHLTLDNGQINSSSSGTGNAGEIKITANTILLDYESSIYTEADLAGGGNISIQALDGIELFNYSLISAEAFGTEPQDKGGNLTINAPNIFTSKSEGLDSRIAKSEGLDSRIAKSEGLDSITVKSEGLDSRILLWYKSIFSHELLI
jgi:hypothetical protein